tara:strand:+ start:1589 stop:1960 length:372 start_codon:yes stop_codon:yes gene_type:complete
MTAKKNKIEESWGYEEIIARTSKYVVKKLFIKAGQRLKKQFRLQGEEDIYVDNGVLLLDLSEREGESNILKLESGRRWRIQPKKIYCFCTSDDQDTTLFRIVAAKKNDVFYFDATARRLNAKI